MIFTIDDKEYKVYIKNGIAKCSLKNLEAGEHDIFIDYYGDDGFGDLSNWRVVTVSKAKISTISSEATFNGVNVKVKLLTKDGKALASKEVTVKFNGKKFKVKTDKNGILTFKKSMKLKKKSYSVKIYYMGTQMTKKLKTKPVSIKVSKTKRKLIIKATINKKIKNKIVKIKVNSKRFTVRTNGKGVAKLTVKKPKRIMDISATYKKSTVRA